VDGQLNSDFLIAAAFASPSGPLTGLAANLTVTATDTATGATLLVGAISETGTTGYYQATIDASQLTRRLRMKVVWSDTTDQLYAESFYAIGDIPDYARTRREVRQRVARRMDGDDRVWSEVATGGTTTTAIVPGLTIGGDGEWRGMWAWFVDGANQHQQRQVTAFDAATDTLTLAPALPAAVATGHRVELYRLRPSTLHAAIDDGLSILADGFLVDAEDQSFTTDGVTSEWALPSDAAQVCEVGLVREDDDLFLGWMPLDTWDVLPGRLLRIADAPVVDPVDPLNWGVTRPAALPDGYRVRVWLRTKPSPPLYDDSFVCAPVEAIVAAAAYQLLMDAPYDESRRVLLPHFRAETTRTLVSRGSVATGGAKAVRA